MSLLLGKDISKPTPSHQSSKHKPDDKKKEETYVVQKPAEETPAPVPPSNHLIPDDSMYDSSPVLKLNSRNFPTFIDESTVDITPGLPSRKKSSQKDLTNRNETPEMPQLVTDLVRENKLKMTAASPLMSSLSTTSSHFTDSPEMPEFTSNIMKTLMATKTQEKSSVTGSKSSRPTPEFPQDLSFLKKDGNIAQSNTPESPVLNFKYK